MLWVAAGVATFGFLLALEATARHYGLSGPITRQAREVIFAPKSGPLLYGGMALMMVVLPWRQRFVAAGVAVGIDVVFFVVRWVFDATMMFGNGALWVVLGYAVIAVTRRTGRERALLLKGVGLGLLLVTGRKTGDTWLLITSKTRPMVLDQYVAVADHALGNPSWLVGRFVRATGPIGGHLLDYVYIQLAVAAVLVSFYQLRNVAAERRFPAHHLVRTFLVIGLLGPAIYMIFPVVGPIFAYGPGAYGAGGHQAVAHLWPDTQVLITTPHVMPFEGNVSRNCMPSLHTAWVTAIFIHSRKGPRLLRFFGAFWLVATCVAMLGFGYHYGADIIAGVVFALTIEAALRAQARGWDRPGIRLVAYGATVFTALLVSYRCLPVEMATYPWVFGPLLLLVTASVIHGYVRASASAPPPRSPRPASGPSRRSASCAGAPGSTGASARES